MFAVRFLRCFLVFSVVFIVTCQVNVISTDAQLNPISSQIDQCRLGCGTKEGELKLTEINGGLYYIHVDDGNKKNWHQARDFCKEHGMELVTIETDTENEAIKQVISPLLNENYIHTFFRIGLNDLGKEGEFRWDSTGKVARFTDWETINSKEPNNYGGSEQCVEIRKFKGNVKWNDRSCNTAGRFICEVMSKNLLYLHAN